MNRRSFLAALMAGTALLPALEKLGRCLSCGAWTAHRVTGAVNGPECDHCSSVRLLIIKQLRFQYAQALRGMTWTT